MSTRESRHPVVSRSQWLAARQQLWLHEKHLPTTATR